jgi:CheY-like chemotaxis protein
MFRILLVDDSADDVSLLTGLMKENITRPYQVYVATGGWDALDFLHCHGPDRDAPRPNLILLDINMPVMNGLELLSRIKSDPELALIPVIMLSSSNSPAEIRRAYATHGNCYVQKPTSLDNSQRLIQAMQAFWMEMVVLPPYEDETAAVVTPDR